MYPPSACCVSASWAGMATRRILVTRVRHGDRFATSRLCGTLPSCSRMSLVQHSSFCCFSVLRPNVVLLLAESKISDVWYLIRGTSWRLSRVWNTPQTRSERCRTRSERWASGHRALPLTRTCCDVCLLLVFPYIQQQQMVFYNHLILLHYMLVGIGTPRSGRRCLCTASFSLHPAATDGFL